MYTQLIVQCMYYESRIPFFMRDIFFGRAVKFTTTVSPLKSPCRHKVFFCMFICLVQLRYGGDKGEGPIGTIRH
jgi:hypothetical protein